MDINFLIGQIADAVLKQMAFLGYVKYLHDAGIRSDSEGVNQAVDSLLGVVQQKMSADMSPEVGLNIFQSLLPKPEQIDQASQQVRNQYISAINVALRRIEANNEFTTER